MKPPTSTGNLRQLEVSRSSPSVETPPVRHPALRAAETASPPLGEPSGMKMRAK